MKLVFFFMMFYNFAFCQSFGGVTVKIHPYPKVQSEMHYYKWYHHPQENNMFIKNFEVSLDGFMMAFSEAEKMLHENELEFSEPVLDSSQFHPEIDESVSFEDLHESIVDNKSKILRTWNIEGDYLSLLMNNDVYMLILGNKKAD